MKILVSGSQGFIGHPLCAALESTGHEVIRLARNANPSQAGVLVHLAARVPLSHNDMRIAACDFYAVNTEGTLNLANQAAANGVKRFVFLSSLKVNGDGTSGACRFTHIDTPAPADAYGISKWKAEQGLWNVSAQTGMEVVILRPPLVYGPGVKGNVLRLMQLVQSGVPLPFGSVQNRRSFVALDNLVDLIIRCLDHPAATGKTFLVSDGQDLSTPELLRLIASSMNRPARLISVPPKLLQLAGRLVGKGAEMDRLLGSCAVDDSYTRQVLGWSPPIGVEAGVKKMVDWFTAKHDSAL